MYCIEASPAEEIERQMKAKLLTRACHMCVVRVVHLTSTRTAHFQRVVPCSRRSGTLNKALRGSATPAQAQGTRRRGPDLHPIRRDEGRRMRGERAFSRLDLLLFSGSGVVPGPFQRLYIQIGSNFEVEVRMTSPPKKRSSFFHRGDWD